MRLYHSPMSIALSCRLALAAADAEHELVIVNALAGETKQDKFLSTNPLGEVPILEHDGAVLGQTISILTFIADHTGKGWNHASSIERAKAFSIMALASSEIQGSWKLVNRPERYVEDEAARAQLVDNATARLDAAYGEVDRQLGQLDGDRELGILDYYLGVFGLWKVMAPAGENLSPAPRVEALKDKVMSSPKLKAVIDEDIASYKALIS